MTYSIVFSSITGNTELIARHIRKELGADSCFFFGAPEDMAEGTLSTDLLCLGSWTDKGVPSPQITKLLASLENKRVFLFGTCGFGESDEYFSDVLGRFRDALPTSCELVGSFMCQGKIRESVRARYEKMLADAQAASPEANRAQMLITNLEHARSHPDVDDLRKLDERLRESGLM